MTVTATEDQVFTDLMASLEKPWKIIVLDDDVSTMEYVVAVFMHHFELDVEVATLRMLEVHQDGRAILDYGSQDEMQLHVEAMHGYKLQATMEQDD